jgi:hypothetical protein
MEKSMMSEDLRNKLRVMPKDMGGWRRVLELGRWLGPWATEAQVPEGVVKFRDDGGTSDGGWAARIWGVALCADKSPD